jgi:hypothetical protein
MAYRQINSEEYLKQAGNPFAPRRIKNVLVTFPSGWTSQEIQSYRSKWQSAINIFTVSHLENDQTITNGGDCPELQMSMDEAVASQLPIIYSEMRLLNKTQPPHSFSWIRLTGRDSKPHAKVRVLNIDIGGGTTDVSAIEYFDSSSTGIVHLNYSLLFKNSTTVAGDALVKRIIEMVLLPAIIERIDSSNQSVRQAISQLFEGSLIINGVGKTKLRHRMSRILRLVIIPIVNHWLSSLTRGDADSAASWTKPIQDITNDMGQALVDKPLLDELNQLIRSAVLDLSGIEIPYALNPSEPLPCKVEHLNRCVNQVFRPAFRTIGRLVAAFDCDLVMVSGKPSELPEIKNLLKRILPIAHNKILFAHDFPVGDWYPYGSSGGRIKDAKSVTVVGAALHQAMKAPNNRIRNWTIRSNPTTLVMNKNAWGIVDLNSPFWPLLPPNLDKFTEDLPLGTMLGRKRFNTPWLDAEVIYEFRMKPGEQLEVNENIFKVTIKRVTHADASEELELTHVCTSDNRSLPKNSFELRLKTLAGNEFWMDNPIFHVDFESV